MTGCDYCYGTMQECPECGPFYYAPGEVVGGQRDAGLYVDGWDLSGRLQEWGDRANARGWTRLDVVAYLDAVYADRGRRLDDLMFRPSPLLAALERPA